MKFHRYIDHDWQMTPIDFQVTRYIDHDWQMTPIDFQVTRSKVKVTVTRNTLLVKRTIKSVVSLEDMVAPGQAVRVRKRHNTHFRMTQVT
ncbi:hypothetical protein DPMN_064442 [Dreissena polymorpha]|uniref:Uncharacterized protein n=1 Tax=Dreissena polymorpha TaxID=45954 RepID=A0A9D4CDL2_DREPO|nr:hypothetical protein DPMN_064442 [Dreissena polymorpha]